MFLHPQRLTAAAGTNKVELVVNKTFRFASCRRRGRWEFYCIIETLFHSDFSSPADRTMSEIEVKSLSGSAPLIYDGDSGIKCDRPSSRLPLPILLCTWRARKICVRKMWVRGQHTT